MKTWTMAALAVATIAAPAQAQLLYSNDFDTENGGVTALNYAGFNGLSVTSGSVDLVHTGDGFGIDCAGGAGGCVDLDGTTNAAGLLSSGTYALATGNRYTLGLSLSGSQRQTSTTDGVQFGFNFGQATSGLYSFAVNGTTLFAGTFQNETQWQFFGTGFPSDYPFDDIEFTIQALNGGTFGFYINGTSPGPFDSTNDNIGMILDNVSLTQSGVPEPATWALMILGMGAIGGAMRRRAATTVRFAA